MFACSRIGIDERNSGKTNRQRYEKRRGRREKRTPCGERHPPHTGVLCGVLTLSRGASPRTIRFGGGTGEAADGELEGGVGDGARVRGSQLEVDFAGFGLGSDEAEAGGEDG